MWRKARLVEKGFTKIEGVDFQKVYSSLLPYTTVRLAMSVSGNQNHKPRILDVKTAFVNARPKEAIYIIEPGGFVQASQEE